MRIPQEEVNVYLAGPSPYGRLVAVLPDGSLERSGGHDAVLVLDPYPTANFGHLVLVFYIQLESDLTRCTAEGGTYLGMLDFIVFHLRALGSLSESRVADASHYNCIIRRTISLMILLV